MPKSPHRLVEQEGETQNRYHYKCAIDGVKLFKNHKQYQLFVRLHRKKCMGCCEANPNPSKSNLEFEFKQDISVVKKNGSNQNQKLKSNDKNWKDMEASLQ